MSKTCARARHLFSVARISSLPYWGSVLFLFALALAASASRWAAAAQVVAATNHSYFLRDDGSLWAWGNNDFSQLGDGSTLARSAPLRVLAGVAAVATGPYHSLA
ncbi:MAG: hypothetical protein F9K47_17800, partial [Burkholderiales bacterium]